MNDQYGDLRVEKQAGISLRESLLVSLPFALFTVAFVVVTDKVSFDYWPPKFVNRATLWLPIIFTGIVYFYVLMNLNEIRKGRWKWYREGLISTMIIVVLWLMLSPIYDWSSWITERNRLGLSHP